MVCALICLGAAIRLHLLLTSPNLFSIDAESYSKLQIMMQWDASPLFYPDINFGPLHMWILQWPWKITGSLVWANRIVAFLLGVGALPLVWTYTRRLFNPAAAIGALAFFTLSAVPVKLSVVTLAEGPCLFFLVLSLYLLHRFAHENKTRWVFLLGGALTFAAVTALRFETWMFLPILPIWLWIRKGFVPALVLAVSLAVFPLVHMHISWSTTGDPINFMHISAQVTQINSTRVALNDRALGFPRSIAYTHTIVILILAAAGTLAAFALRKGVLPATLLFVNLAVYEYKATSATLAPEFYRYLAVITVLVSVLWVLPVSLILGRIFPRRKSLTSPLMFAGIGLLLGILSYQAVIKEDKALRFSDSVFEMTFELKNDLKPSDRIFMGNEFHPLIVSESGLSWANFKYPEFPDNRNASRDSCREIITDWKPTVILVYAKDRLYTEVLDLEAPCTQKQITLFDQTFIRAGLVKDWCWYRS